MTESIITYWPNLPTTSGRREAIAWDAFFATLENPPGSFRGDREHPGWSPATFKGDQRKLENVERVYAAGLDFDGDVVDEKTGEVLYPGITLDQAAERFARYHGFIHTTRRHTLEAPRFRVLLTLARPVSAFEYSPLWRRLHARWPEVDDNAKDASRFWYLPGARDPSAYETRRLRGTPLDPDAILCEPEPGEAAVEAPARRPVERGSVTARAVAYLAKMPAAISGSGGHDATWAAALALAQGFDLDEATVFDLLWTEYNPRCKPPWKERELRHKARQACTKARSVPRGYILEDDREPPKRPRAPLPAPPPEELPPLEAYADELAAAPDAAPHASPAPLPARPEQPPQTPASGTLPPIPCDPVPLPEGVNPYADLANAHRLVFRHGADLRYVTGLDWLAWDSRRWRQDDTGEVHRRMHEIVRELEHQAEERVHAAGAVVGAAKAAIDEAKRAVKDGAEKDLDGDAERAAALARANVRFRDTKEALDWAQKSQDRRRLDAGVAVAKSLRPVVARVEELDVDPWAFTCLNGVLDLRTCELREHRREDMCTRLAPVAYDPNAIAPTWIAFLDAVFAGNGAIIEFVQRFLGYSLTGITTEQCFAILWGSTGSNGKSTLLELLRHLLGDFAANTSADTFMVSKQRGADNDVARLRGARLVTASESGEGRQLDEERVKRLTGDDMVTARFLFKEPFEFKPNFKLWLALNSKPTIKSTTRPMWRRIRLIPFEVTFTNPDQELPRKLRTELPGILRWAVDGCRAWQRDGLKPPADVADATEAYRAEQDVVASFIEEACVVAEHAGCRAGQLYEAFVAWCKRAGEDPLSNRAFGDRIAGDARFVRDRDKWGKRWKGIAVNAPAEADPREAPEDRWEEDRQCTFGA